MCLLVSRVGGKRSYSQQLLPAARTRYGHMWFATSGCEANAWRYCCGGASIPCNRPGGRKEISRTLFSNRFQCTTYTHVSGRTADWATHNWTATQEAFDPTFCSLTGNNNECGEENQTRSRGGQNYYERDVIVGRTRQGRRCGRWPGRRWKGRQRGRR